MTPLPGEALMPRYKAMRVSGVPIVEYVMLSMDTQLEMPPPATLLMAAGGLLPNQNFTISKINALAAGETDAVLYDDAGWSL
jgi:hypothetical protein